MAGAFSAEYTGTVTSFKPIPMPNRIPERRLVIFERIGRDRILSDSFARNARRVAENILLDSLTYDRRIVGPNSALDQSQ